MNFRPIPPNEVGRSIYTGARIRIRLLNGRPLPHVLAGNGGLQLWARAGSCLHQAWRPQPPLLISPWGNLSCARMTRPKSEASPEPSCATHPPGHRAKTWRLKPSPRSHLTDLPAHLQDVTSYPNIGSRGWGHAMASLIEHAHTHTHTPGAPERKHPTYRSLSRLYRSSPLQHEGDGLANNGKGRRIMTGCGSLRQPRQPRPLIC